jgi:hypothetical protein
MREADAVGWRVLNPGITTHKGQLVVSIRLWGPGAGFESRHTRHMANLIGRIGDQWRLVDARPMKGGEFEDLRLFELAGSLKACAVATDRSRLPRIAVLDLDARGNVIDAYVQPASHCEKNWMPVVVGEQLRFIYRTQPLIVTTFDPISRLTSPSAVQIAHDQKVTQDYQSNDGVRGGTPLVPYEDGWLAVVHERDGSPVSLGWQQPDCSFHWCKFSRYSHRFARFSRDLTRVTVGPPWVFRHLGIEFCCGLVRWGEQWVLSYGFEDRQACLAVVGEHTVRELAPEVP